MDVVGFGMAVTKRELEAEVERLGKENAELKERVRRLEELLKGKASSKSSRQPTFGKNYGLAAHEGRLAGKRKRRRKKKSTGRRPHGSKADQVAREVDVYPPDVARKRCVRSGQQRAWRLVDGQAIYVQYNLYALPGADRLPTPPGLRTRRSEYGLEVLVSLAFLHYWIGLSIDNARQVMCFFTGLDLSKSQADSLLSQLARDWSEDYDAIVDLIAMQMVVYVDETGWKVRGRSCYTWAFSCASYVLFRCGVGRGKEEAQVVLGERFAGIGVSDDYSVYKNQFHEHQLCWAHLLRKAIKLVLQHPDNEIYGKFLDKLYQIYRLAVRLQKDRRLSVGRAGKVRRLKAAIKRLCHFVHDAVEPDMPEDLATYVRLHHELADNVERLFVFVAHPEVEPTNNRSERNVRREAEVRKAGRTSKTTAGAHRRSVIMTILASLRTRIASFTLKNAVAETSEWIATGQSIFQRELAKARAGPAPA